QRDSAAPEWAQACNANGNHAKSSQGSDCGRSCSHCIWVLLRVCIQLLRLRSRQVWYLFATSAVVDHPYSGWWSRVGAGASTILAGNDSTDSDPAPRSWSELRDRCLYQRIGRVLPRTSY